jgi:hypothetical protein
MKTMTCRQMGGPCDAAFHGNKADEMSVSRFEAASQVTAGKGWLGPQWHLRWWLA